MYRRYTRFFPLLFLIMMVSLALPFTALAIGEVTPSPEPDAPAATPTPVPTAMPDEDATDPGMQAELDAMIEDAIDLIETEDFQAVVDLMDEALSMDPRFAEAYLFRGVAYSRLNNLMRAVDDFTRAIDIEPWQWDFYLFRGDAYFQLGETGEAILDYDRSIELNPRFQLAFRSRAIVYASQNNIAAATQDDLMARGLDRLNFDDFEQAIEIFTEVLTLDEEQTLNSASAYYNRGLAYYYLESYEVAIEDFSLALEIYPEMHDSYLGRGIVNREAGNVRAAGDDFLNRIELLEKNTFTDSIESGETLRVEMAHGNVYRITFEGMGGEIISVSARDATGDTQVDPLLVVLGPDGQAIAGDDDFGGVLDSELTNVRLPADGTYTLVVSHANGGFDGTVAVTLE